MILKYLVVVYKTTKTKIYVADPAQGLLKYSHGDFNKAWTNTTDDTGFVLLLEPNAQFYVLDEDRDKNKGFSFLVPYFKPYKKLIHQLFVGLLVATVIQFLLPFFMQSVVDIGVNQRSPIIEALQLQTMPYLLFPSSVITPKITILQPKFQYVPKINNPRNWGVKPKL